MLGKHKKAGNWLMGVNILCRRNMQKVWRSVTYWSSNEAGCLVWSTAGTERLQAEPRARRLS